MDAMRIKNGVKITIEVEESGNPEHLRLIFYIFFLFFLIFFFVMEGLIHKTQPIIGHQTVFTILLGLIWSVFWYYHAGHDEHTLKTFEFSQSAFFDFLLPPSYTVDAMGWIRDAAASAGRNVDNFEVPQLIGFCADDHDPAAAIDWFMRALFARTGALPSL